MQKAKKKQPPTLSHKNPKSIDNTDEQNILQEVLKIIQFLYSARLIDKIVRPIDKKVRQQQIQRYGIKLQSLHDKIFKIKSQLTQITYSEAGNNNRNRSVFGQVTNKPSNLKKMIRVIESKYIEVLLDGSYKHFKKICTSLQLTYDRNMDVIDIQAWAAHCLDTKPSEQCC